MLHQLDSNDRQEEPKKSDGPQTEGPRSSAHACLKRYDMKQSLALLGGVFICDFPSVLHMRCTRASVRQSRFPTASRWRSVRIALSALWRVTVSFRCYFFLHSSWGAARKRHSCKTDALELVTPGHGAARLSRALLPGRRSLPHPGPPKRTKKIQKNSPYVCGRSKRRMWYAARKSQRLLL